MFRKLALALPDVVEGEHHHHPDFRLRGRVIASLHPDGLRAMVKLAPDRQRELVAAEPATWSPATGAWGRAGCTMLVLAKAERAAIAAALSDAWQSAMATPSPKGRRSSGAREIRARRARPGP